MRFLTSLALLSSLTMAEKVPVLSEPRTAPESGHFISLNAWGDTLVGGRWGQLQRFVRRGDVVIRLDSLVSDSIKSEMPRVLGGGYGSNLIVGIDRLLQIESFLATPLHKANGFDMNVDYGKAEGDWFLDQNSNLGSRLLAYLCGPRRGYLAAQQSFGKWTVVDSLHLSGDTVQVCSVDPKIRQVVRIQYSEQGAGPATVWRGNARDGFTQLGHDTLTMKPDAVFAAWDGTWLAYEKATATVRLGGLGVQATYLPQELLRHAKSYTKPARKDSLVVFAGDSTLVLAKWTRDHFNVTSSIKLDARIGNDIAIGDSTVWVKVYGSNSNSTLSFRLRWEERNPSATSPRQATAALQIRSTSGGVQLTHEGVSLPVTFLEPSGRVVGQQILTTGTTRWTAPHTGLFLVHTPQGTQRIMVK